MVYWEEKGELRQNDVYLQSYSQALVRSNVTYTQKKFFSQFLNIIILNALPIGLLFTKDFISSRLIFIANLFSLRSAK